MALDCCAAALRAALLVALVPSACDRARVRTNAREKPAEPHQWSRLTLHRLKVNALGMTKKRRVPLMDIFALLQKSAREDGMQVG